MLIAPDEEHSYQRMVEIDHFINQTRQAERLEIVQWLRKNGIGLVFQRQVFFLLSFSFLFLSFFSSQRQGAVSRASFSPIPHSSFSSVFLHYPGHLPN